MNLFIPDADTVIELNQKICEEGNNPFHCFDPGKVDSAIHTAFYPGSYPYAHGGIPKLAGALAFYLCQAHAFQDGNKRTASVSAVVFLNAHGLDIQYPISNSRDDFSELMIGIASGITSIDETKQWFAVHKVSSW